MNLVASGGYDPSSVPSGVKVYWTNSNNTRYAVPVELQGHSYLVCMSANDSGVTGLIDCPDVATIMQKWGVSGNF